MENIIYFSYIQAFPLKLKVEYFGTLTLKSKTMMMAVEETKNKLQMVVTTKRYKGWWAASDSDIQPLANADSKGLTNRPNFKRGQQWARADSQPNFKKRLMTSQNPKRAGNGPGLTKSQISKGPTMGLGRLRPKHKRK